MTRDDDAEMDLFDDGLDDALMNVDESSFITPFKPAQTMSQPEPTPTVQPTPVQPIPTPTPVSQTPFVKQTIDFKLEGNDEESVDAAMKLNLYYRRLFPFDRFIQWLSYGDMNFLSHRELSFTIKGQKDSDIYIRYCSYSSKNEVKDDIIAKNPDKIDIGAVYSARPKMKNSLKPGAFKPVSRELVIDIDMTDYDPVRTCCSGADVCLLCWKFMAIAVKIINRALTEDFGFKNLLWVFSGRRGVHCWVCDERARNLSEDARKALISYLEMVRGGDKVAKKVTLLNGHMHPSVQRSYEVVSRYFEQVVLEDQDVLSDPKKEEEMAAIIPNETLRQEVLHAWRRMTESQEKWKFLVERVSKEKNYANLPKEIMFQYLYPRLDAQVSVHLNHLLKSPFCVHPKTGKVCVPFRPEKCDRFDPHSVPTTTSLIKQINEQDGADWKQTDLREAIEIMDEFLEGLKPEIKQAAAKRQDDKQKSEAMEWM